MHTNPTRSKIEIQKKLLKDCFRCKLEVSISTCLLRNKKTPIWCVKHLIFFLRFDHNTCVLMENEGNMFSTTWVTSRAVSQLKATSVSSQTAESRCHFLPCEVFPRVRSVFSVWVWDRPFGEEFDLRWLPPQRVLRTHGNSLHATEKGQSKIRYYEVENLHLNIMTLCFQIFWKIIACSGCLISTCSSGNFQGGSCAVGNCPRWQLSTVGQWFSTAVTRAACYSQASFVWPFSSLSTKPLKLCVTDFVLQ